ncbi:MAG: SdpI family protein [Saprospiraceae bacterium]|nr:SdpI family protein [Saprospiraceae bacterium]
MKSILNLNFLLAFAITLIPFLYLALIWTSIPDQVALHFGSDMQPDRFGHKKELLVPLCILGSVSLITYLILQWLPSIDPKQQLKQSGALLTKLGISLVVFFSILNIYILYSSFNPTEGRLIFVLLGGLFAVLGNLFHSVKPNYFVGFRLPWTLEDEDNWRHTHQLASKIWVMGGLALAMISILIPLQMLVPFFLITIMVITLIPAVYSFIYFKKNKRSTNS